VTDAGELALQMPHLLPEIVIPIPDGDGLDTEYRSALRDERLVIQRCSSCGRWQWGPEWICLSCRSFDLTWEEVPRDGGRYRGVVYSWSRVWHPTHPKLGDAVPYVVIAVTLPGADDVRMIGNLVGEPRAAVEIGSPVQALFEHHERFTLVQWERCGSNGSGRAPSG
jgi:uncharacterized OB-fold protein